MKVTSLYICGPEILQMLHQLIHEESGSENIGPVVGTGSCHTNQRESDGSTCYPTKADLSHETGEAVPPHPSAHTVISATHTHGDSSMEGPHNSTLLPYTTVGDTAGVAASTHPSSLFSNSDSLSVQTSVLTRPEVCSVLPNSYSHNSQLSTQKDIRNIAAAEHSSGFFNSSSEPAPCASYSTNRSHQLYTEKDTSCGAAGIHDARSDLSEYLSGTFSKNNGISSHQIPVLDPKPVASVRHYSSFDLNEFEKYTVPYQSNATSSVNYTEPFSGPVIKTEEPSADMFNPQDYLHSLCYSGASLGETTPWHQQQHQASVESTYDSHSNGFFIRNVGDNRSAAPASLNWHMGLTAAQDSHVTPIQDLFWGSTQSHHTVNENLETTYQPRTIQPVYYNPREERNDANQKEYRNTMCSEQTPWQQHQKPGDQMSHLERYWHQPSYTGDCNTQMCGIAAPQQREWESK